MTSVEYLGETSPVPRARAVTLLSGGLDSTLAISAMLEQRIEALGPG